MITDTNTINKYKENNKIYVPTNLKNQNYKYILDNDTLTIITNANCYTNYNSTYCDCIKLNIKYNIITETYSCNTTTNSNNQINYRYITDDINDSYRITRDINNNYTLLFGVLIIAILLTTMFKKNSRRM